MADGVTDGGGLPESLSVDAPNGMFAFARFRDAQTGEDVLTIERIQLDWRAGGVIQADVTAVVAERIPGTNALKTERDPETNRARRITKHYEYPRLRINITQGQDTDACTSE